MSPFQILETLRVAGRAAADAVLRNSAPGMSRVADVDKGGGDFATKADLASHDAIAAVVASQLHGIDPVTEEDPASHANVASQKRVVVWDPLDGTHIWRLFAREWGITLCYMEGGRVQVAVLLQPELGLELYAIRGQGAFANDERFTIPERPSDGALVLGLPLSHALGAASFTQFVEPLQRAKLIGTTRALGAAVPNTVEVLFGRSHAYLNFTGGKVWDLAAAGLIVEEAGGSATLIGGGELVWDRISLPVCFAASKAVKGRLDAAYAA